MGGGDALHPFQRLYSTLRLPGLGGLGAETSDKAFEMSDFALLLVVSSLLQGQAGRALLLEGGVVAAIKSDPALVDMDDMIDHVIQDITVVRNQQQRSWISP